MRLVLLLLSIFLVQCSPVSRESLERPKLKNGFEYYAASVDSLNSGSFNAALDLVNEAIKLNPRYSKFYLLQGDIYNQIDNKEAALKSYTNATKLRSASVEAYLRIANIYEKEYKNYDEAIKYYRKASSIDVTNYKLLLNIGECYLAKNEITLAKNKSEEYRNHVVAENKTPDFGYYYLIGRINYLQNNYTDAKSELLNALKLQPLHFDTKLLLIRTLFKLNELEKGLQYTNELLNQNDQVGELYYFRALYYFKKEKYDDALRLFNQALNLDQQLIKSHFYLGKIYEQTGDKEKSLYHLQLYRKSSKQDEYIIDSP